MGNIETDDRFLEQLMRHEGKVTDENGLHIPYRCSARHLTIGYGHNLDANPVPGVTGGSRIHEEYAQKLLKQDVTKTAAEMDRLIPWWRNKTLPRQAVLLNMAFNMGVGGLLTFRKFLNATKDSHYKTASDEMLDSKWARQDVGKRAIELAAQMLDGEWQ